MQVSRRSFGQYLSWAGLLLMTGFTSMAISCQNVFQEIMAYIPAALQALQAILQVLAKNGVAITPVVNTDLAEAKVAFADLQADVADYQNAPAASKATLAGKVSTSMSVVMGGIQKFWTDLNLPDGNVATIVAGVLGVVLSTMAAYQAQLPPPAASVRAAAYKALPFTPKKRSPKEMRQDINKVLADSGIQI